MQRNTRPLSVQRALDALSSIGVGAGYFSMAWLSTHLTPRAGDIAYVWPAGGFMLGVLLVAPPRLWLWFLLSGFIADIAHADAVSHSVALGIGYSAMYFTALGVEAALLRRFAGAPLKLDSIRKLALFVAIAPLAGNLSAAALGALISHNSGQPFFESLWAWWISDALGMLLITPFIVSWSDFRLLELRRLTARAMIEGTLCALGLVAISRWSFGERPEPNGAVAPLTHFLIPFLVWASLRFGVRGQSTAVVIVCAISVTETMNGMGPFSAAFVAPVRSVLYLQIFLIVAAAMTLVGAVVMKERRAAQRAAEEWRLRYETAVVSSGNLLYDANLERQRVVWGGDTQKVLGCRPEEIADPEAWLARVHPDDRTLVIEQVRAVAPGEERAYSREYRVQSRDGTYIEVEETGRVIGLRKPGAMRIIGMLKDVTERKRTQVQRERLDARLREAQKVEALGTMAGGIAHDFNNILGAVLGHAELALSDDSHEPREAKRLRAIMDAALRGKALVEQILTFARRGMRNRRPVALWPVILEVRELLSASTAAHAIELVTDDPSIAVLADATRMHQLSMNLATNAIHAMPAGGRLTIELSKHNVAEPRVLYQGALQPGAYTRLRVSDTGEGIAPEVRLRMFEPFYTTKAQGKGTGLGLALVQAIVADHDGAIEVSSQLGVGTCFDIYLPLAPPVLAHAAAAQASPHGEGRTVMIVDDDGALLEMTEDMLARLGYEPVGYELSVRALEALRADPDRFDAVLTDESMPELSGTELARALQELRPDLPVIVSSGYGAADLHLRARAAGACAVINKPYDSNTLAQTLVRALKRTP
jgi:PAS domain S-box-containing protein